MFDSGPTSHPVLRPPSFYPILSLPLVFMDLHKKILSLTKIPPSKVYFSKRRLRFVLLLFLSQNLSPTLKSLLLFRVGLGLLPHCTGSRVFLIHRPVSPWGQRVWSRESRPGSINRRVRREGRSCHVPRSRGCSRDMGSC